MSKKKDYFIGVDWAADPPAESQRLVDAIICDPSVKKQIEKALEQTHKSVKNPPSPEEITLPIKIMAVPGLDASSAYIISPGGLAPTLRAQMQATYDRTAAQYRAMSMGAAVGGMLGASAMMGAQRQAPFFVHALPGVGVGNAAAVKNINPWGPKVFAEMGERCKTCENALICNVEKVCPVVCAGCKGRYFMYNDCEVKTHQICLGFDWEKAKKDYQCDRCAKMVLRR
jgi:hypothetical protein